MAQKKKSKYTQEEMNAMRINALLNGVDPESLNFNEEDEDIDIEIEDEKAVKKAKKQKKEEVKHTEPVIHMQPEFEKLKKKETMQVSFGGHDIHYKEQLWPVPLRTVVYNVELVVTPKVAKDIALKLSHNSFEEGEKAYRGDVRYYKVITYENVLYKVKELGYIKVIALDNGKLKIKPEFKTEFLKSVNINPDNFKKSIQSVVSNLVER